MTEEERNYLREFIKGYCENVTNGLSERWEAITPDLYDKHIHDVIAGLMARQATLAIELAKSPSIWNANVAPLILRTMTDGYITLAWILDEPNDRAKKYLDYGLGQEKLNIEILEESLRDNPEQQQVEERKEMLEQKKLWLNSQLAEWATIVNVGSWSGKSTRAMAQETGLEQVYKFSYVPFSGSAHNMWQHVGKYNIEPCQNPLHNNHLVPLILKMESNFEFVFLASLLITDTFEVFDEKCDINIERETPLEFFHNYISSEESNDEPKK